MDASNQSGGRDFITASCGCGRGGGAVVIGIGDEGVTGSEGDMGTREEGESVAVGDWGSVVTSVAFSDSLEEAVVSTLR